MRVMTALALDAAHRNLGHSGKCAHLHGTPHLEVTVGAQQLTPSDRWDHATLLWQAIRQNLPSHVVLERVLIRETLTCSTEISRA